MRDQIKVRITQKTKILTRASAKEQHENKAGKLSKTPHHSSLPRTFCVVVLPVGGIIPSRHLCFQSRYAYNSADRLHHRDDRGFATLLYK